jgi:hypothetical protein
MSSATYGHTLVIIVTTLFCHLCRHQSSFTTHGHAPCPTYLRPIPSWQLLRSASHHSNHFIFCHCWPTSTTYRNAPWYRILEPCLPSHLTLAIIVTIFSVVLVGTRHPLPLVNRLPYPACLPPTYNYPPDANHHSNKFIFCGLCRR